MTSSTGPASAWPSGALGAQGPSGQTTGTGSGDTNAPPTGATGPVGAGFQPVGTDSFTASWRSFAYALGVSFPASVNRANAILRGLPGNGAHRG